MTIVDSAVYVDGKRAEEPRTLAETHEAARERGGVVWIGLSRPAEKEFQAVAEEFGLHELAVEDAVVAHQRPKIERYGNTLFVVLKAARYLDAPEEVKRLSEVGIQQNDEVKKRLPPATKRAKTSGGLDYDGRYRASDRDSRC